MIGLIVNKILKDSTTITELVGDNIAILQIKQTASRPFIVVNYSSTATYSKSSFVWDEADVEVSCVANSYSDMIMMGLAVRRELELFKGAILESTVIDSRINNIVDDVDGEHQTFTRVLTFQIKYK
jgi:hypothetical protein